MNNKDTVNSLSTSSLPSQDGYKGMKKKGLFIPLFLYGANLTAEGAAKRYYTPHKKAFLGNIFPKDNAIFKF